MKLDQKGFSVYACCLFANGTGANMLREKMSSKSKVIQLDVVSDEQLQKAVKEVKSDLGPKGVYKHAFCHTGVFCFCFCFCFWKFPIIEMNAFACHISIDHTLYENQIYSIKIKF